MFRYCPKCRNDKIEFIGHRFFKCKDCEFTYFHNVATATAAIITYNNQILMTERAQNPGKNMLDLPGGFVNPNETLEQCLSREVNEELGLTLYNWQYLCGLPNTYTYKNITYNTQDCIFTNRLYKKPPITIEHTEIKAYHWLDLNLLDTSLMAFQSLRKAVTYYMQRENNDQPE